MSGSLPSFNGEPERVVAAVMIHDHIIADGIAASGKYAKLKAAKEALQLLQGLAPFEYRLQYRCDCKEQEDVEEQSGEIEGNDSAI